MSSIIGVVCTAVSALRGLFCEVESKALVRSVDFKTDACENKILRIFNGLITNPQDFIFAGVGFKTDGSDQGLSKL